MAISGPTVVRRQLGRRLQHLREAAGKTAIQVEQARLVSRTKLWRVEGGQAAVKVADVWALCRFYGVADQEVEALSAMAVGTAEQGWWEEYADVVPDWFKLYVGLEAAARRIFIFEEGLVPGELQTAGYAHAVHQAAQPHIDAETLARYVSLRLERQQALFGRDEPPAIVAILDEAALARQVGGPDVMAAQRAHLREMTARDHVEVRVVPFDAGAHAGMSGAFRILDFVDDRDPDVVYLDAHTGARYLEKPAELAEHRRLFGLLRGQAVPIGEHAP